MWSVFHFEKKIGGKKKRMFSVVKMNSIASLPLILSFPYLFLTFPHSQHFTRLNELYTDSAKVNYGVANEFKIEQKDFQFQTQCVNEWRWAVLYPTT